MELALADREGSKRIVSKSAVIFLIIAIVAGYFIGAATVKPTTITITKHKETITTTITNIVTKTITTAVAELPVELVEAGIQVSADVYRVVDGDTFDAIPIGRVRLADVNAPELREQGGYEAKDALKNLVLNKKVYVDVDDVKVMDRYNRLVCVVYVRYNSTHLLNVNKWLLDQGLVSLSDRKNEFNPYKWKKFIYYPE